MNKKNLPIIIYCISIFYSIGILFSIYYLNFGFFPLFWLAGMLILKPIYKSDSYWMDGFWFLMIWLIARGDAGHHDSFIHLSFILFILIFAGYSLQSKIIPFLTILISAIAISVAAYKDFNNMNFYKYFLISTTILGLIIYFIDSIRSRTVISGKIDFILSSYSGNTGHYSNVFIESARKAGAEINIHRFHYYKEFKAVLNGNSLIISFPVFGWKPPWHLAEYILSKLPRGNGKPAFILYSSYGGPENAGFIAWLLLTIKGYRVIGRNWAMYPMNVATFRIGTSNMWKNIDLKTPSERDISDIKECAQKLISQQKAGLPIFFIPFFLFIIGFLLDNKWINIFIYRNYAWRRRCNKCGKCINACPSQRLYFDKNKYPAAKGTCALCLLCINICPTNAMQLRFWTEYGHPYNPRWPEFVIKNKKDIKINMQ